jgi:O-antigen/teichoic acid export membrane protein
MLGGLGPSVKNDKVKLSPLLKEVSVLSGGILVGLLVSQLDRIILSRTVSVEDFGIYTVVATLALAFLQLQVPISRAYFPMLVNDIRASGQVSVMHLKKLLTGTILSSTLPALLACVFAPQILIVWLRDPQIAALGTVPLRLLLVAISLNGIYGCVYQLIIAIGKGKIVLKFNFICLVIAMMTYFLVGSSVGILLGGFIWISTSFAQIVLGALWFYRNKTLVRCN